jgi:hypothetical protein
MMFPPRDPTRRRFLAVAAVASAVSERVIADDLAFLAAHPVRQSNRRSAKGATETSPSTA